MTRIRSDLAAARQHQFGLRLAARLDAGAAELPHDISERLRAARQRALSQRKPEMATSPAVAVVGLGQAALQGPPTASFWQRLASVVPLVALVAGLVAIHAVVNDHRARELADVDAALLTDDLPPEAYADPGFLQFLKGDR